MGAIVGKCLQAKFALDRFTKVRAFRKKCQRPMETQWAFLKRLLRDRQETDFGRKYGFAEIRDIREYQRRVPIQTWDDVAPYIEEVKQGHPEALFPPSDPIIMYAATSGTTGEPKFIPVTKTSYNLYGNSWDLTWGNILSEAPKTFYGKILYFPGDPAEGHIEKIPYGAITANAYSKQNGLIRGLYAYPYQISKLKDYPLRYFTIMRVALEADISFIPIANPSTILTLFRMAQERREELIEDIRRGELRSAEKLPKEVSNVLLRRLRPNPKRARELEEIYLRTGDFLPCDYWDSLEAVMCFTGGPLRLYLNELTPYIGKTKIFDTGLFSSEGKLSFPVCSTREQEGCCLTIESNYFEFIPEEQVGDSNPDTLTLDQCEVGKRYFIIITNASGLYRYNISDLIEVTGFYGQVPLIIFCNKGKNYSSITGEKLTEFQVTESVRKAGERVGRILDDFIVCLHWDKSRPCYSLLKGHKDDDNLDFLQKFISEIEEELMRMNMEYRSKRQSHRLGPITLKIVEGHSYEDYEDQKKRTAHNMSQYKHVFLVGDPSFEGQFQFSEEIASAATP